MRKGCHVFLFPKTIIHQMYIVLFWLMFMLRFLFFFLQFEERKRIEKNGGIVRWVGGTVLPSNWYNADFVVRKKKANMIILVSWYM